MESKKQKNSDWIIAFFTAIINLSILFQQNKISKNLCHIQNLINTILWGNDAAFSFEDILSNIRISYSLLQGSSFPSQTHDEGNNLMNQNPLFVDEINGNYGLQAS